MTPINHVVTIPNEIASEEDSRNCYQPNDVGNTCLHEACIRVCGDDVAALIRDLADRRLLDIKNDKMQTPLHLAALKSQPGIIRMLMEAGANVAIRDYMGNTALHLACMSGDEECVRAFEVNQSQVHFDCRFNDNNKRLATALEIKNYNGDGCVHLAAQGGFANILSILVSYGADINDREGRSGRTPLHIAVENDNEKLAKFILFDCTGVDFEIEKYDGLTAFQIACIENKLVMQNIFVGKEPALLIRQERE